MKVKSMRGVVIDLAQIMAQNEKTVAIGNARMNARGDEIGAGGQVLKRREQIASEYHAHNPKAVKKVSLKDLEPDVFETPADAVKRIMDENKVAAEKMQDSPPKDTKAKRTLRDSE